MTASTFESYRSMAAKRPARGVRYLRSVTETLADPAIHPVEAMRLTEARDGLLDGLRHAKVCSDCGRALEKSESIERGRGPVCAHRLAGRVT